ncbi:TIR domain-containing protein [Gluconacetobacter sacchari]|uniref:TIR domain-containing protein n=1 Tax=Gluconacetobacter sacchari TaxID=92759 RepID=UPI0039B65FA6
MTAAQELFALSDRLDEASRSPDLEAAGPALERLDECAAAVGRAFSGSWLGYHARVYYAGLQAPPPGAHFSQEWGLMDMSFTSMGSVGEWREFQSEAILDHIRTRAENPDLAAVAARSEHAGELFKECISEIRSILLTENTGDHDTYLSKLLTDLEALQLLTPIEILDHWSPKGQKMTRDTIVLGQGTQVPPHMIIKAENQSIRQSFGVCVAAAKIARQAASHVQRKSRQQVRDARIGTNVFIGHGRSPLWRELKDFIQDRLQLPWDEFNRIPVAGVTNQARLVEMLESAAVAFMIMTAEDETAEGAMQARMNVIHEVGLFQGRLGFTKAIVVLEEGCAEFSNIQGLGQIRFPAGNIGACFEEIRSVLEREGLLS